MPQNSFARWRYESRVRSSIEMAKVIQEFNSIDIHDLRSEIIYAFKDFPWKAPQLRLRVPNDAYKGERFHTQYKDLIISSIDRVVTLTRADRFCKSLAISVIIDGTKNANILAAFGPCIENWNTLINKSTMARNTYFREAFIQLSR